MKLLLNDLLVQDFMNTSLLGDTGHIYFTPDPKIDLEVGA